MGSRANVAVKNGSEQVWFYCHWSGGSYVGNTRKALARKQRWNDPSYLARIIFDGLTEGHQGEELGFGISGSIGDNEYPILVVDVPGNRVFLVPEKELEEGRVPNSYRQANPISFADFVGGEEFGKVEEGD